MTKRAVLIIVGVIITTLFTLYILDIDLFGKKAVSDNEQKVSVVLETQKPLSIQTQPQTQKPNSQVMADYDIPAPQPTQPVIINGKWELVWQDDFDEPGLSYEEWTKVERRDNYNRELQYYSVHNAYIDNGMLYLTAEKEELDGKDYISGMVQTENKVSFLYGRIEARMKLPEGKGLFPAFWLLSDSYEIDIMEMIGSEPDIVYGVNHCLKNGRTQKTYGYLEDVDTSEFHLYALEWEKDELRWYIDDEFYYSTNKNVSDEEMYILFTLAIGGVWPGSPNKYTVFPSSVMIDEISLYKDISMPGTVQ